MDLDLDLWSSRFSEWMRLRNWSEQTIRNYKCGLRQFFEYLQSQGVSSLGVVTRELVEGFRTHLFYRRVRGKPLTISCQSGRLQTAKSFLRYLARENYLLADPSIAVDLPKVPRPLPRVLSEQEVLKLLEAPDTAGICGIRDRAVLEVFYATGVRNQELAKLCLDDLDREHQALWVREGKGKKSRMVPLGEEALAWLDEYLARVRPKLVTREKEARIFLSSRGRPMSQGVLVTLVRRHALKVGLKQVKPHTLRHSCATHMLARGAELRHLQALLGHSSPSITEHYTRVELSDLHKVLRRCHPREKTWGR